MTTTQEGPSSSQNTNEILDEFGKQFAVLAIAYASCSYLASAATKDYYVAGWQEMMPWALGLSAILAGLVALLLTQHAIETALKTEFYSRLQREASGASWKVCRIFALIALIIVGLCVIIYFTPQGESPTNLATLWIGLVCVPVALWAIGEKIYSVILRNAVVRSILYGLAICSVISLLVSPLSEKISGSRDRIEHLQICIATISDPSADAELKTKCTKVINAEARRFLNEG